MYSGGQGTRRGQSPSVQACNGRPSSVVMMAMLCACHPTVDGSPSAAGYCVVRGVSTGDVHRGRGRFDAARMEAGRGQWVTAGFHLI